MSGYKTDAFDALLADNGAAAVVFRRKLLPVEGKDAWIFPPTFAQSESADDEDEGGGGRYQIEDLPNDDNKNVCVIDSIGSQANRMEPIFKKAPYSSLVPQVVVQFKNGDKVNVLDAGHRAADAVIRFSKSLGPRINDAFKAYQKQRDCSELIKLVPTSLIFGVWDSRATGAKIQRVLRSVVRAYNVNVAKRSATYQSAYDYTTNGVLNSERDKGSGKDNPLSQEGFKYSLASNTHGGVLVKGEIVQEAMINLVALRALSKKLEVRRYMLGLSLVSLSYRDEQAFNLREGCLLRAASETDFNGSWTVVYFNGTEETETLAKLTHDSAVQYAQQTVKDAKIESPSPDDFDEETADKWLQIEKKRRKTLAKTTHPAKAVADEATATAKKNNK